MLYKDSLPRGIYLKLGEMLSGISADGWKKNLTIANSVWTAKIMKEVYGVESVVIYPPVASEFPNIPWDEKEFGFVSLARIVPEKRIDRIIEILRRLRNMGWDIHLHILGRLDNSNYGVEIKKLCEKNSEWIFLEGLLTGQKKLEFIARHKFSISGINREAFGIAVAEAVKAGCIVWVPNGGGQVEIVNHPALIYNDADDAVNKIEQIFRSDTLQIELLNHLMKEANKFSTEMFQSQIKKLVRDFLTQSAQI